ncbi:MAG: hypothetical protein FWE98_05700 [Oscillospiraceae bacterium]|nr:hypothetical protein [Oscillospiraceae bacterium]
MQTTKNHFFAAILCMALLALCACGRPAAPEETTAPATIQTSAQTTTEVPTTTEAPTEPVIEYPASYKDAPKAYKPILDDLYRFAYLLVNGIRDGDRAYGRTGIADTPGFWINDGEFRHNYIGYAIKDINKDGIPELLILTAEMRMLSLFTLKGNEPVHLDSYWIRSAGRLAADGTIYVKGSPGSWASYKLEPGAVELTTLTEYGYETHWENEKIVIRILSDDEERIITPEKFDEMQEKYSNPPNPMQLTFIPIEQ